MEACKSDRDPNIERRRRGGVFWDVLKIVGTSIGAIGQRADEDVVVGSLPLHELRPPPPFPFENLKGGGGGGVSDRNKLERLEPQVPDQTRLNDRKETYHDWPRARITSPGLVYPSPPSGPSQPSAPPPCPAEKRVGQERRTRTLKRPGLPAGGGTRDLGRLEVVGAGVGGGSRA